MGTPLLAILFLLELRVNYGEIEWVADLANVGLAGREQRNWWDVGGSATFFVLRDRGLQTPRNALGSSLVVLASAALREQGAVTKFCRGRNMLFCVTVSYQPRCRTVGAGLTVLKHWHSTVQR